VFSKYKFDVLADAFNATMPGQAFRGGIFMEFEEAGKWISEVAESAGCFLASMRDSKIPGRFRYSLSGDIPPSEPWGLGNTVFAVKIAATIGRLDALDDKGAADYIKSFEGRGGRIVDLLVLRRGFSRRAAAAFRSGDFGNVFGRRSVMAQTRQAVAALLALEEIPDAPYADIPKTPLEVERFVEKLDWRRPWGAASHVNHLAFFLKRNAEIFGVDGGADSAEELIDAAFSAAERRRNPDGSWGVGELPAFQKINGAMKMVVAAEAAGRADRLGMEEELSELCLKAVNDAHACDNLNVVKVAAFCRRAMDSSALERLLKFALDRLDIYKKHYFPEHGGFSFLPGRANGVYYGARISRGLPEPDIHGTHLFTWGLALIAEILEINTILREPPT
jgi:hypothetical protein